MTLLILSDSHGHVDAISEAIRRVRPDGILFAGDGLRDLSYVSVPCPLWAVRGNCDWSLTPLIVNGQEVSTPEFVTLTPEGVKILLLHGHTVDVKSGLGRAVQRAVAMEADILVFGHTHLPLEYRITPAEAADLGIPAGGMEKDLLLFNPGSIGGREGSFGTLTLRNGQALFGHGKL